MRTCKQGDMYKGMPLHTDNRRIGKCADTCMGAGVRAYFCAQMHRQVWMYLKVDRCIGKVVGEQEICMCAHAKLDRCASTCTQSTCAL